MDGSSSGFLRGGLFYERFPGGGFFGGGLIGGDLFGYSLLGRFGVLSLLLLGNLGVLSLLLLGRFGILSLFLLPTACQEQADGNQKHYYQRRS